MHRKVIMAKKKEINFIVPEHIAIIMDGNGRWAKKNFLPRSAGHAQGSKNVEKICEIAYDLGVKYLTIFAFSTENWSRSKEEINTLMQLFRAYMKDCMKLSKKNNLRVRVIGDISRLDKDLQERIKELEQFSSSHTGLQFQVAINYGGKDELLRASKKLARACLEGKLVPEEINETVMEDYLDTKGIPAPDLLIRTSGEQRISNFMLWQMAYTELYFTDVMWPAFHKEDLVKAIEFYNGRDRRFGGRKE